MLGEMKTFENNKAILNTPTGKITIKSYENIQKEMNEIAEAFY